MAEPQATSPLPLDSRELATVLAALRRWQGFDPSWDTLNDGLRDTLTVGGTVEPLSNAEIDSLCERFNGVGTPKDISGRPLGEAFAVFYDEERKWRGGIVGGRTTRLLYKTEAAAIAAAHAGEF